MTSDCQTMWVSSGSSPSGWCFFRSAAGLSYHAAAYKHVSLVEYNIAEAVKNNVRNIKCCESALAAGASKFILISTDKAVRQLT